MDIVNQLYDLGGVPVEKRQTINNIGYDYVFNKVCDIMREYYQRWEDDKNPIYKS